jgi:hypothetical protein
MALNANLVIDWAAVMAQANDISSLSLTLAKRVALVLSAGTTVGQADLFFDDTRTVGTTGLDALNLFTGLTNGANLAVSFRKLKAMLVVASATNGQFITVSQPTTTGVSGLFSTTGAGIIIRPGTYFAWAAGAADATCVAVTSGAATINILNSGVSTISYDLVLIGTTV